MPAIDLPDHPALPFHWPGGHCLLGVAFLGDPPPADPASAVPPGRSAVLAPFTPPAASPSEWHAALELWLAAGPRGLGMAGLARLATMLDGLCGSAWLHLAGPDALARAWPGPAVLPGGLLWALIATVWCLSLSHARAWVVAFPPGALRRHPDPVGTARALAALTADVAPVPPWPLGQWDGDPARPPRGGGVLATALPGGSLRRAAASLPADHDRLDPDPALSAARLRLPRPPAATAPAAARLARGLGLYGAVCAHALRLSARAARLVCAASFRTRRLLPYLAPDALPSRRARALERLDACTGLLVPLAGLDAARLPPLPAALAAALGLDPAVLLHAERRLEALWIRHGRALLAQGWGVRDGDDHPDRAGPLARCAPG